MKNVNLFALAFLSATLFIFSCKKDNDLTTDCDNFHFEYEGMDGPVHWETCFADCGGTAQSPVALTGDPADSSPNTLETHYEEVPIDLINNGHTVEFEYETGSKLTYGGDDYSLLQFHFHTMSEHTINGTRYPMEAHLVHQNSTGGLVVIGIMIEEGAENPFLKNFSDNLPAAAGFDYHSSGKVTVGDLIPSHGGYFTYSGSLTTPPCSEIVTWIVMKEPVQASAAQIENFHAIMHDNYRPLQDLNGRAVMEHGCDEFHWSYEGEANPAEWATCFTDCGGAAQSPVALTGSAPDMSMNPIEPHYEDVPIDLVNNGHTIEFEYEAGSKLDLEGEEYELLQFHFHTMSEHTINGTRYPMEAHLVHKNMATGALAVIGVMIEEGAENSFLKNFSDNLPNAEGDHFSPGTMANVEHLLPTTGGYYSYSGSLTTPPCSEIVTWIVMKQPVQASAAQIQAFHNRMHDNYRPLQDLNGRAVSEHSCNDFHFAYDGEEGPDHWATCFADCGGGTQSPIDIAGAVTDMTLPGLEVHYENVPIELINNGHTVEFEYETGSKLVLNGEDYKLLQFHFHSSSEHTVGGTQYPMEAHLVHINEATGALAVIGIFFENGAENTFLKNFSDNLPASSGDHYSPGSLANVEELLPADGNYYTYTGSLTTPPCSEIVTWIVMKAPVEASSEQLSNFSGVLHDNFRPVQDLNGRTVLASN